MYTVVINPLGRERVCDEFGLTLEQLTDRLGNDAAPILNGQVPPTLAFIGAVLMRLPILFGDLFAVVESGREFTGEVCAAQVG